MKHRVTPLLVATLFVLPFHARSATPPTPEQQKARCWAEAEDYSHRKKKRQAYFDGCMKKAAAASKAAADKAAAEKARQDRNADIAEDPVTEAGSNLPEKKLPPGTPPAKEAPTKLDLCAARAEKNRVVGVRRVPYINECMKR